MKTIAFVFCLFFSVFSHAQAIQSNGSLSGKRVSVIGKIDSTNITKDGVYLNGYVVNLSHGVIQSLVGKSVRITGKVTVVEGADNSVDDIVKQGRAVATNHILRPKVKVLKTYSQSNDILQESDSVRLSRYIQKLNQVDLYSQERQLYLDSILLIKPKSAYIWQQKAMPLFKQKKYSIGMAYLDKAVEFDTTGHWLEYRAFIKCIFQKDYLGAIADFDVARKRNGFGFVMDHSYDFYTGLSYLQLNEFSKAANYIQTSIDYRVNKMNGAHYLENFYLGIVQMEMGQLDKAISLFDAALNDYSHFSDAKFYKAQCLLKSKKINLAEPLYREALKDLEDGFTINEDNVIYESYPYQVSKAWLSAIVKSFNK